MKTVGDLPRKGGITFRTGDLVKYMTVRLPPGAISGGDPFGGSRTRAVVILEGYGESRERLAGNVYFLGNESPVAEVL